MAMSTGDIFWGQAFNFCYWPCMVCPDPEGNIIRYRHNWREVHVVYFAYNLQRNWIKEDNFITFRNQEDYEREVVKKTSKFSLTTPKACQRKSWQEAIKEAAEVAKISKTQRLEKLHRLFNHKKELQKLQRRSRKENVRTRKLPERNSVPKTPARTKKRCRSPAPCGQIKRRRLREGAGDAAQLLDENEPQPSSSQVGERGSSSGNQSVRPIDIVIESLSKFNKSSLFQGLKHEPVCKYCFQPRNLLKCSIVGHSWFHAGCMEKEQNNESPPGPSTIREVACKECALNEPIMCSVCNKPNDGSQELMICNVPNCSKALHPTCCRYWPQANVTRSTNRVEAFRCPSHVCQSCVADDPNGKPQHLSDAKVTRCLKCPASYHADSTCIPAGSQVLTAAYIICPRHSTSPAQRVHANWCFICGKGGQRVCCSTCPVTVHAKCAHISDDRQEDYNCQKCSSGRLPLYGDVVWAKFTKYRWWPAIILPPGEVPSNIMRNMHNAGDFVVRFLGSHNNGWISRSRIYLYAEDNTQKPRSTIKKSLDRSYFRGIEEAKEIQNFMKTKKQQQNRSKQRETQLRPLPYVNIKINRAVHPVRLRSDMKEVNVCNCNPDAEHPCGPDSDCLNRLVLNECNPKMCPAGKRCQNQMFQSRIYPRMDVVYMNERGFGLVCREDISEGTFVIEYVGEVINEKEFQRRMTQKKLKCDENFYFFHVQKDYVIDAELKGNIARFLNHSCDPNCEAEKWMVNGITRVGIFATKDIPAHTELTFNYKWEDDLGGGRKPCFCKSSNCAGVIGGKNNHNDQPTT